MLFIICNHVEPPAAPRYYFYDVKAKRFYAADADEFMPTSNSTLTKVAIFSSGIIATLLEHYLAPMLAYAGFDPVNVLILALMAAFVAYFTEGDLARATRAVLANERPFDMSYQRVCGLRSDVLRFRGAIVGATVFMVLLGCLGIHIIQSDPSDFGTGLVLLYCCVFCCAIAIAFLQPTLWLRYSRDMRRLKRTGRLG